MQRSFLTLSAIAGALALALGFAACDQHGGAMLRQGQSASDSDSDAGGDAMLEKITPKDVTGALDALNIAYQIQSDPNGYPMIAVDPSKLPAHQFNILFFNCDKVDAECEDIALWSYYDPQGPVSDETISAWNDPFKDRHWSTAYIDKDNDPSLVMNINATGGIGVRALQILVNTYVQDIYAFHDSLGQKSSDAAPSNSPAPPSASFASSGPVDPEIVAMTSLIKEYGSSSYEHVKQDAVKN